MKVMEMMDLTGRTAVVSGGAGAYGRQIAQALAEAGATTFMASRDTSKLEKQSETFRAEGLNVSVLPLDQSSEESVKSLLETVLSRTGRVDVLVNNAVSRPMNDFDSPASTFSQSMDVNATGIFLMTRTFGQHMARSGLGGSIINVASIQGMVGPDLTLYEGLGWGSSPDYFFHKGGMIQLTRYAAAILGKDRVRVNSISPGGFFNNQDARFVDRYTKRTFLNRMANDSDLKGAIVFLASDASAYVTGTNLPIDGGYTAK